jgi:hypothetical protein
MALDANSQQFIDTACVISKISDIKPTLDTAIIASKINEVQHSIDKMEVKIATVVAGINQGCNCTTNNDLISYE